MGTNPPPKGGKGSNQHEQKPPTAKVELPPSADSQQQGEDLADVSPFTTNLNVGPPPTSIESADKALDAAVDTFAQHRARIPGSSAQAMHDARESARNIAELLSGEQGMSQAQQQGNLLKAAESALSTAAELRAAAVRSGPNPPELVDEYDSDLNGQLLAADTDQSFALADRSQLAAQDHGPLRVARYEALDRLGEVYGRCKPAKGMSKKQRYQNLLAASTASLDIAKQLGGAAKHASQRDLDAHLAEKMKAGPGAVASLSDGGYVTPDQVTDDFAGWVAKKQAANLDDDLKGLLGE